MLALALTERELELVLKRLDSDDLEDRELIKRLEVKQAKMLERKKAAFKEASTPSFEGCKVYAVVLDAVGGIVAADYCLSAGGADDAAAGLEEELAMTNYGDWDATITEVTQ